MTKSCDNIQQHLKSKTFCQDRMKPRTKVDPSTVRQYWENRLPGTKSASKEVGTPEFFKELEEKRYNSEFNYKYFKRIAEFDQHPNEKVLEVGTGLGTDILQYAKGGADVYGIDLTENAVKLTRKRFEQESLKGNFYQANFVSLPFEDNFFDVVCSFGVLHHSEETQQGIDEIYRVLKPGGKAIILIYHKGFKYYIRKLFLHGIIRGEYFKYSTQEIINHHTEEYCSSPLTKVYSKKEAAVLFKKFCNLSFDCYRLDDYFYLNNKRVSLAKFLLPKILYRKIEKKMGWNLIIKAQKHLNQ